MKSPVEFRQLMEALVRAKGHAENAYHFAKTQGFAHRVLDALQKNAIASFSTTNDPDLVGLVDMVDAWFSTLRNISLLDAMLDQGAKRIPANVRFVLTTLGAAGHIIDQGAWFPIEKFEFDGMRMGFFKALAAIVITDNLDKFSAAGAHDLLNAELANGVAAATNAKTAQILLAGVPATATTGNARLDLQALFAHLNLSSRSRPLLATSPQVLKQLALLGTGDGPPTFPDLSIANGGGTVSGCPLIAVDELHNFGADGDVILAVDCAQISADAGALQVLVSNQATLQMSDAPTQGASNLVSLYQTNSLAILTSRNFSLEVARAGAVSAVKNVSYFGSP